jgi:hypothetical protein
MDAELGIAAGAHATGGTASTDGIGWKSSKSVLTAFAAVCTGRLLDPAHHPTIAVLGEFTWLTWDRLSVSLFIESHPGQITISSTTGLLGAGLTKGE